MEQLQDMAHDQEAREHGVDPVGLQAQDQPCGGLFLFDEMGAELVHCPGGQGPLALGQLVHIPGQLQDGPDRPADKPAVVETQSGSVGTDGSTSMAKVISALGESFMNANPDVTFTYDPTGSGSGITAAQEGRCDIGLASRALKGSEKESGLTETVLAYDGIAMVVHPDNKVDDLSIRQIADMYAGKITNWSEVGGDDAEIVLIGREAGSGTRDGFESITGTKEACQYRQELTATGDVIATVSQNPGAIGYASLSAVKDSIKALKVDGVAPSEATVQDGGYAVQRPFMLITKTGAELGTVPQAFFDYITSPRWPTSSSTPVLSLQTKVGGSGGSSLQGAAAFLGVFRRKNKPPVLPGDNKQL